MIIYITIIRIHLFSLIAPQQPQNPIIKIAEPIAMKAQARNWSKAKLYLSTVNNLNKLVLWSSTKKNIPKANSIIPEAYHRIFKINSIEFLLISSFFTQNIALNIISSSFAHFAPQLNAIADNFN